MILMVQDGEQEKPGKDWSLEGFGTGPGLAHKPAGHSPSLRRRRRAYPSSFAAISASLATVFRFRPVPDAAAGIRNLDCPCPMG